MLYAKNVLLSYRFVDMLVISKSSHNFNKTFYGCLKNKSQTSNLYRIKVWYWLDVLWPEVKTKYTSLIRILSKKKVGVLHKTLTIHSRPLHVW